MDSAWLQVTAPPQRAPGVRTRGCRLAGVDQNHTSKPLHKQMLITCAQAHSHRQQQPPITHVILAAGRALKCYWSWRGNSCVLLASSQDTSTRLWIPRRQSELRGAGTEVRVAVHVKQTEGRGKAWQDPTSVFIKKRYQQVFCAAYSLAPCAREAPPPPH